MGKLISRRSHNGKVSVYEAPYMKGIKWSRAQKAHRQRMGEASRYASAAVADPDIRPVYVQMAVDHNKNPKRPFDMAVSDYYHHGNDLLWKKHMGDLENVPLPLVFSQTKAAPVNGSHPEKKDIPPNE